MEIKQKYIPINTKRRSGQKILGVKFIVSHDTGNIDTSAKENVDYFIKSANESEASAHAFVDDIGVIECIPQDEKAWHVRRLIMVDNVKYGVDSNDYALGIELCFFTDIERSRKAYNNYVEYIKELCKNYRISASESVIGHYTLDPSRRKDPMDAFNMIKKTWDEFIKDLQSDLTDTNDRDKIKEDIKKMVDLL